MDHDLLALSSSWTPAQSEHYPERTERGECLLIVVRRRAAHRASMRELAEELPHGVALLVVQLRLRRGTPVALAENRPGIHLSATA